MTLNEDEVPVVQPPADPDTGELESGDHFGKMVARGFRWSLVSSIVSRFGTVFMGIVLARLLAPSEYGVYTVAFVALIVLSNTNDLGVETAFVRYPDRIDDVAPTAVTVIGLSSIVQFAIAFAAAPWFARELGSPDASGVIRLLTVCILINGAFAVQSGLLTREFQQGRRAIADLVGLFVSVAVTIAMAAAGYGPWSLAWGRVVGNAINGLLHFVLARARYRPRFDRRMAASLLVVGLPIAGAFLFTEAVNNVDYVVVGRELGATALGVYLLAFNLSSWPLVTLSWAVSRVSVPGFARLQKDKAAVEAAMRRALGLVVTLSALVCAVIGTLALPLIRFVYGPPWASAALALRFLVVLGAARAAMQLCYDLLYALGRGRATLIIQVTWFVVLVPTLTYGAQWDGIRGVGIGHMIVVLLIPIPGLLYAMHKAGLRLPVLLGDLPRPLLAAAAAGGAAWTASQAVSGDFLQLAVGGVAALAVALLVAGKWVIASIRSMRLTGLDEQPDEHAPFEHEQAPL